MPDELISLIEGQLSHLVPLRHEIHRCPELGYEERATAKLIVRELEAIGVEYRAGLAGGTGVVAHLPATEPGERLSVGLRADIDALPILEQTGKAYASVNEGVMHACGHDGHTTILLGAARVLASLERRPNPVTFVFQPAEEGGGGGERMCDDGALRGQGAGGLGMPVGRMFGLHGWPQMPLGVVASRPGPLLAATDEFGATITGCQAHAAYPHMGQDPILAAAHAVTALQSIASRNVSPLDSVVVTVGQLVAGTARNVIPQSATLAGTIRTLNATTRSLARRRVVEVIEQSAGALGCHAEVEVTEGYPVTENDPSMTEHFFAVAKDAFGDERVELVPEPTMGGEDFSYYGQHVPACFFLLGLLPDGADADQTALLHQPTFDFNDDAIATGVEAMCRLALAEL